MIVLDRNLTDYSDNKSQARHIHTDECKSLGLTVLELESDQELVLTVHHAFSHTLMNAPSVKITGNYIGREEISITACCIEQRNSCFSLIRV